MKASINCANSLPVGKHNCVVSRCRERQGVDFSSLFPLFTLSNVFRNCHREAVRRFPIASPTGAFAMKAKLDARTVAALTLADGKAAEFYWDDQLDRFGLRLRRSGDRVLRSWVVQYRALSTSWAATSLRVMRSMGMAQSAAGRCLPRLEVRPALQVAGDMAQGDGTNLLALDRDVLGDGRSEGNPVLGTAFAA